MQGYNTRNPAVKRILQELKELQRDDDPDILAEAIEDNIFEWHFVIRGAWDSEFEGGIYHGRILMPAEYPFKPPAFVMLTPSGRFETGVKICLSISSHHPESWQPSWSVRSALVALIAFMQTPGNGALGSLDHPTEARRQMAAESRTRPPTYGGKERQQLIAEMHQRMMDMEERSRQLCNQEQRPAAAGEEAAAASAAAGSSSANAEGSVAAAGEAVAAPAAAAAQEAPQQHSAAEAAAAVVLSAAGEAGAALQAPTAEASPAAVASPAAIAPAPPVTPAEAELRQRPAAAAAAAAARQEPAPATPVAAPAPAPAPAAAQPAVLLQQQPQAVAAPVAAVAAVPHQSWEDRGLTYLAILLSLFIAALVIRKVLVAFTFQSDDLYNFNHVEGVEL